LIGYIKQGGLPVREERQAVKFVNSGRLRTSAHRQRRRKDVRTAEP